MTTSTSPATVYRYSVTSKRTAGRPRKLSVTSTLVAASSTLIRRNSIRNKKCQPKTSLRKSTLHTICEDESEELEERLSRFGIKNPTMNLISLKEAARRPELTKELFLGGNMHTVHYSLPSTRPISTSVHLKNTRMTLISLGEAARRPELTKKLYLWTTRRRSRRRRGAEP